MIGENKNIKFLINWFLGPFLFVWLSYAIYQQLQQQPNLSASLQNMKLILLSSASWKLCLILLLMMVNWGIEAAKWRILMHSLEEMSWWRSIKSTLAGLAFAMNTPNRIGEYGGRVLYVHEGNRLASVSLSVAGSFSQLIVTMLMGCAGMLFLIKNIPVAAIQLPDKSFLFWMEVTLYIASTFTIIALLFYFRLGWMIGIAEKIPGALKFIKHITVLESLSVTSLLRVFVLSFLRYLVFILQYLLMLQLMQVDVNIWQAIGLVSVMFFVLAVIPTIALAELGLRGTVSLQLFGWYSSNAAGILATTAGIWFINLVLPALLGSVFILGIRIFRNK